MWLVHFELDQLLQNYSYVFVDGYIMRTEIDLDGFRSWKQSIAEYVFRFADKYLLWITFSSSGEVSYDHSKYTVSSTPLFDV